MYEDNRKSSTSLYLGVLLNRMKSLVVPSNCLQAGEAKQGWEWLLGSKERVQAGREEM
jgi:hypothetical protein